jgi:hypothetical protein
MALIYKENTETLETMFNYLKINYFFNPSLITVDFGKAGLKVISKLFTKNKDISLLFSFNKAIKIRY